MSAGQVTDMYQTKQIGNGQQADNHRRVIRWLSVQNFEHAQNSLTYTGISLGMRPANERRRYIVTTYLIGWAHA